MCVMQHTLCIWFSVRLWVSYTLKHLLDYLNIVSKRAFTVKLNFSVYLCSDTSMLTL